MYFGNNYNIVNGKFVPVPIGQLGQANQTQFPVFTESPDTVTTRPIYDGFIGPPTPKAELSIMGIKLTPTAILILALVIWLLLKDR